MKPVQPMPKPLLKIPKGSHFAFMPDGERMLVAGASRAWMASLVTGDLLFEFDKPARFIRQIAVSEDGAIAAMALSCERVFLYNAQTGKKTHSLNVGEGSDVSGFEFVHGSHDLLHASWRILTTITENTDGSFSLQPLRVLEVWPDNPMYYAVTFAASVDRFACFWTGHGTYNISVLKWPLGDEIERLSWKMESWQPHSRDQLCFSPDDDSLLLTNPDGSVTLHSLTNSKSEVITIDLNKNATETEIARGLHSSHLCFSPDRTLLACNQNSTLGFWAWPSGQCFGKWRASGPEPYFGQIGFSKSGHEIVVSFDGTPSGIFVYRTADFINSGLG